MVTFIALAGIPITTIQASQSSALTVMDQTADIDYGNKITISTIVETEVESQEIEAVRTLFKARGGSTIWSYSYPDFSTNGSTSSQITVTFDILTGPGSYYPPGTDFDIEIEVTLTTGEVLSVQSSEPVEYLDPSNDWQREKGNGYTIIYYGVSQSAVKNMIATIDNRIPTLEATLGVTETPNFKAVVFPSIQSAAPSFPPVSQSATDQFLFAGFAQPEYRLFVQGQINSSTFTHELAHLYTHEAVSGSFLGGIPAWLNEGLARFLESGSSENSNNRLRSNVRPDELLSLNHMGTVPGLRSDVIIFYPQAGAFVGYLVEKYSPTTMSEFLAMLNKGRSVQDAFELIFDTTLREAENDWRALFGAEPLTIPSATVDPADTIDNSVPATSVPLVDYSASGPSTNQPSSTTTPEYLPTITPENPAVNPMVTVDDEPTTNWLVAGIVIGLSAIVGLWLFTSRRRMPKRNS
ncbi:MAG: hypothetical protein CL726_05135 [Chloroflexi bacterium]|nr:hypothetical protein [Chloroflexota bacterium]